MERLVRPEQVKRGASACRRDESGNILVLFAILLPMFLLIGAIAVDVGYWWVNGKKAQIAADACALAAAQELPQTYDDLNHCQIASADDYVLINLPYQAPTNPEPDHLSTRVTSPYNGDPNMVEATVKLRVRTFFGRIVGLEWIDLTRRAVAEREIADTKLAIFAGSTDCSKGLRIDGDGINVEGHLHSNGEYTVNGAAPPDQFTATSGTIAKENCIADTNPDGPPPEASGAQYGDGPDWLPQDGVLTQWPDWWTPAQFGWYLSAVSPPTPGRCTYKGTNILISQTELDIDGAKQTLATDPSDPTWTIIPTGTYCATSSFKVGGNYHRGTITALAPIIVIDGKGQDYTPYAQEMLFFTVPNSNTDPGDDGSFTLGNFSPKDHPPYPPCNPSPGFLTELNGEEYTWGGIIFNPCGRVKINNKSSSVGTPQLVGTIYGFEVEINGDDFNMQGTEDIDNSLHVALVE